MPAPQHSSGRYYRPELDVLRFVAFLLVFLHHLLIRTEDVRISNLLGGFASVYYAASKVCGFGLSLFFTLSAFLICELLLREREVTGTVAVRQFYIRRILRIWPLYYLGLALSAIFIFLPGGHRESLVAVGWFAVFGGAWFCSLHGWLLNPGSALWSISVEEQFYLVAPWVTKYCNRKALYGFSGLLIVVADIWLYFLGRTSHNNFQVWANSFVQFECFAAGILLCLALRGRLPKLAAWQRLFLLVLGFASWFFACYGLHAVFEESGDTPPGSWHLICGYALVSAGCVLVLLSFLGIDSQRFPRWAVYCGRISFGLYVFHQIAYNITGRIPIGSILIHYVSIYPLRVALNSGLTLGLPLGLTFLMAMLSYRYFETPFLRMKKRHAVIESQPLPESN